MKLKEKRPREIEDRALDAAVALLPSGTDAVLITYQHDGDKADLSINANVSQDVGFATVMMALNESMGTQALFSALVQIAQTVWVGPGHPGAAAAEAAAAAGAPPTVDPSDSPSGRAASSASSHASPEASESPPDGADEAPAPASRGSGATAVH